MENTGEIILKTALSLTGVFAIGFLIFLLNSPGKPAQLKDSKGDVIQDSISEKTWVEINGIKLGMFIKGNNINNPILLFLHGGPGMPEYGFTQKHPTHLEKHFVVCWYEQRGAGISYHKNIAPKDITVENIVSDTVEVANYLKKRFGQDRVYLMGHSWGTLIGLKTIKQRPDLFYAYIGVAQIVNTLKSEQIAYEYMLGQYNKLGNKKMVKNLETFKLLTLSTIPVNYAKFRDKPMHELGIGSMRKMNSVVSGIFIPIMKNNDYTFSERINIWKAKNMILNKTDLWRRLVENNFTTEITSLDIPVYFLHGINDYTVNYYLTKDYFEGLAAPVKGFYTFNDSAHSPIFEEPEKAINILLEDVLKNETKLSDK
jgi:pimeloyl-ACP methyl ester carboxylesterase